jgi:hypothetical protein
VCACLLTISITLLIVFDIIEPPKWLTRLPRDARRWLWRVATCRALRRWARRREKRRRAGGGSSGRV